MGGKIKTYAFGPNFGVLFVWSVKIAFFSLEKVKLGWLFIYPQALGLSFYYISISFKHVYLGFFLSYYFATWS